MALPALTVVLENHRPLLKRFSANEVKLAIRAAFEVGAQWWIANYLPLRFKRYARAKLGYEIHSSHIKRKRDYGVPEPLVWTGETREAVLQTARVKVGGSAKNPYADVKFRTGGPRDKIVYEVLNTILDSEMPGVARVIDQELNNILGQAQQLGGTRSKRLTLTGASSLLNSDRSHAARRAMSMVKGDRNDAVLDAGARREEIASNRPSRHNKVRARLKRTHDRWRRTSGGSAPTQGGGLSQTYQGSSRHRHAQAQARYRSRYR